MNFKTLEHLDNLIIENGLNNSFNAPTYSDKKDIMQTAKYYNKINKSLTEDGETSETIKELSLKTDEGLKYFKVKASPEKNTKYFIKIGLIDFYYMNKAQADKTINL